MPIIASPIGDGFQYIWEIDPTEDTPAGTSQTITLNFAGDDLVYAADGSLFSGSYTGYTLEAVTVYLDAGTPVTLVTPLTLMQGVTTEVTETPLEDMWGVFLALFLQRSDARSQTGGTTADFGVYNISGIDGALLEGSQINDGFDLYGTGAVLKTRSGDDYVSTQNAEGLNYVNLGGGDDVFRGGAAESRVWGAAGDDTIYGGAGDDRLMGGLGRDWLEGQHTFEAGQPGGDDLIKGGGDGDFLRGYFGDDSLMGGSGADVLVANQGNDKLWGGTGRDAFVFNLDPANVADEPGVNQIRDFDVNADFLWITNGNNGNDFDAQDGYDAFMAGAEQRAWGVIFKQDALTITLRDVTLSDLSTDHFVEELLSDGTDFGFRHWADIDTDTWTYLA